MLREKFGQQSKLVSGYREYRRTSYILLHRAARDEGLLEFLETPRAPEEIVERFGYDRDRIETLEAILGALETVNAVRRETSDDGTERFVVTGGESEEVSRPIDVELLKEAVGADKAEAIVYAKTLPDAFVYLRGEKEENTFGGGDRLSQWTSLLEFPYWDFGRKVAASIIARPGATVVDFASGLGHGVRALAEAVGPEGRARGVEMNEEFVRLSSENLPPNAEIRQGDLNEGIDFFEDESFDGAMMIGAFHFIRDKAWFVGELRRILRPGSKVVLGNVVRRTNAFDQAAHDITGSMLRPRVLKETPEEIRTAIEKGGLAIVEEYDDLGCVGWYELAKS